MARLVGKILGAILIVLALGFAQWDGTEYTIDTPTITIAWDPSEGATSYKVRAVWIDPTQEFVYGLETVTTSEAVISKPRTGHFRFEVAACNEVGCSEWAVSSDPAYGSVDGQPNGWRVFWKVAPPSFP
jgi:hypothetical protein